MSWILDYELLKRNFDALESHWKSLEAEIESINEIKQLNSKFAQNSEKYKKHMTPDMTRPFQKSDDWVSLSKYREVADKLVRERLKNEKLREELSAYTKKNTYLYESNRELTGIFEKFLKVRFCPRI